MRKSINDVYKKKANKQVVKEKKISEGKNKN